jgi:hypothetical protein
MWRRVDLVWTDVSEERWFTQNLHGTTFQKTAFLIYLVNCSAFILRKQIYDKILINNELFPSIWFLFHL